jgi:hypothetical protein
VSSFLPRLFAQAFLLKMGVPDAACNVNFGEGEAIQAQPYRKTGI